MPLYEVVVTRHVVVVAADRSAAAERAKTLLLQEDPGFRERLDLEDPIVVDMIRLAHCEYCLDTGVYETADATVACPRHCSSEEIP